MEAGAASAEAVSTPLDGRILLAGRDAAMVSRPEPPTRADVVVIGGGCMGTSSAFHLARRGLRVALLERDHLAAGATGHSGALVRQYYETRIGVRLARAGLRFFQGFEKATGVACGFVQTGFISGARPRDVAALETLVTLLRSEGVDARIVSPAEAKALEPGLAVDDLRAAMFDPEAGYADPILTTTGFARAAEANGAHIVVGATVRRLVRGSANGLTVRSRRGDVRTSSVVVTAGVLANALLPRTARAVPMTFERGDVGILRRPADAVEPPRLHFDVYNNTYSRPEGSRDVLVGYLNRSVRKIVQQPERFDDSISMATIRDLRGRLAKRFPLMVRAQPRGGWGGLYDVTPDGYPVVDRVAEGIFVCAGFSGHGFKLSPRVGELLAEFVATGRRPMDLEPLRASRFGEKQPVTAEAPFPSRRGPRLP